MPSNHDQQQQDKQQQLSSQEEPLRRMLKIVNSLMARSDCSPFCEPVDWRGLELWDYPKIITKMMDLGTVKRKLERGHYPTAHACALDIRLVWKNCCTYNADGSDFWLLAKAFSRRFEDRYRKVKAEYDVGEDYNSSNNNNKKEGNNNNNNKGKDSKSSSSKSGAAAASGDKNDGGVTLDAKAGVAEKIFLLSGTELAHVMTVLENQCPLALEQLGKTSTHIEINLDALDPPTFSNIERYVNDKIGKRHGDIVHDDGRGSKRAKK